jgi:hypothetical protein
VDFPESLQEMFDKYYEFHRHIQFHGKTREPNPDLSAQADTSGARQGMFFGQGGEDVDKKAEIQNFFHRFDEELVNYLDGEDIPMVMAGVGYLHPLYKEVNSYPKLLDHGITKDVDHVPVEELHELTWELVKNQYAKDIDQALGVYKSLRDKDRDTTDEVEKIVSAAFYKRIHTLFIAEDADVWGKFDEDSNDVTIEGQQKAGYEDLLSFSAGHALLNGGNVLVLPPKNIPDQNTAAAILRF